MSCRYQKQTGRRGPFTPRTFSGFMYTYVYCVLQQKLIIGWHTEGDRQVSNSGQRIYILPWLWVSTRKFRACDGAYDEIP